MRSDSRVELYSKPQESNQRRENRVVLRGVLRLLSIALTIFGIGFGIATVDFRTQSVLALNYDDTLRSMSKDVPGKIVDVEEQTSGLWPNQERFYFPVVRYSIGDRYGYYQSKLREYKVQDDEDYYRVGEIVHVMYDPFNPLIAGIKSDAIRDRVQQELENSRAALITSSISLAVGSLIQLIQLIRYLRARQRVRRANPPRHLAR